MYRETLSKRFHTKKYAPQSNEVSVLHNERSLNAGDDLILYHGATF